MIDPKDYDNDLIELPGRVWALAEQIRDNEETEKHINHAKAAVRAIKYKQKAEDYKMAFIIAVAIWFYTTFFAIVAYFTRI